MTPDVALIELIARGGITVLGAVVLVFVGRFLSTLLSEIRAVSSAHLAAQQKTLDSIDQRLEADGLARARSHHEVQRTIAKAVVDIKDHVENEIEKHARFERRPRPLADEEDAPPTARSSRRKTRG